MIKATPYIHTNGYKIYKEFLLKDFNINYFKLDNVQITLTSHTELTVDGLTHRILLPIKTLNDFVNNIHQLNIMMYWSDEVEAMFEPKHLIKTDEIKLHYWNLLHGIEKSFELL